MSTHDYYLDDPHAKTSGGRRGISRRKARMRRIVFLVIVLLFVWWFNNYTLKTNNVQLHSAKLNSPLRIAIISDLHATRHGISNRRIIDRVTESEPDMIVMLGDMYTRRSSQELIDIALGLTTSLVDTGIPVYFVTGDHDTDESYKNSVRAIGAHLLDYKSETVEINGNKLQIMGIDNVYYSATFDLKNEFTLDGSCYSILIAHIPNYAKFADFGADLTLCADTHGGMARLPFGLGPVYYSEKKAWLPKIRFKDMRVYDKGFFDYSGGTMFITSGIGDSPAPVRLNNRPEVVVMDILPGQEDQ